MNDAEQFEEFLKAMEPPRTIAQAINLFPEAFEEIKSWKKSNALQIAAGLHTELIYHPNAVRLDWLLRLILVYSEGKKKPQSKDYSRLLNKTFEDVGITRLEDPVEDVFVDRVVTSEGEFLVFTGHYEDAAANTQTVIDAFELLPPHPEKDKALRRAFALLKVCDSLVKRAGLGAFATNDGQPWEAMRLPSTERLRQLSRRVRFSDEELRASGISPAPLEPFFLHRDVPDDISTRTLGDSIIDLAPLMKIDGSILVYNPAALTLAARGILLKTVKEYGLEKAFLRNLMSAQLEYTNHSSFWPGSEYRLPNYDKEHVRSSILPFANGRFLQVIQVMPSLEKFPTESFGSIFQLSKAAQDQVDLCIESFWTFLKKQDDYRESRTVLLLSTWGCGVSLAANAFGKSEPEGWQFLAIPYAHAAMMGVCDDGKLTDIWRIVEQQEILENTEFQILNANGTLNLFGHWKETSGQFVPEDAIDANPPLLVSIPTNSMLTAVTEAKRNQGLRSLRYVDGSFKKVQKVNWGDAAAAKHIFASVEDIKLQKLLGVIPCSEFEVWIECQCTSTDAIARDLQYQIWNACLEWMDFIRPHFEEFIGSATKSARPPSAAVIRLDENFSMELGSEVQCAPPEQYLSFESGNYDGETVIRVNRGWAQCLRAPQNSAEVALISMILVAVCESLSKPIPFEEIKEWLLAAVGSENWRWLHAKSTTLPAQTLMIHGFTEKFRPVPHSAIALAKTNSVWEFYDRSKGNLITGSACVPFLAKYNAEILAKLIRQISKFDRLKLVESCLKRYNAGRGEHETWKNTFLALHTIEGDCAYERAFRRQNDIFGTQRTAKVVSEIAAVEARVEGGLTPSKQDVDDLFALAFLLVGNGNINSLIASGFMKPEITISPTGDLLVDRTISSEALEPASIASSEISFKNAAQNYAGERSEPKPSENDGRLSWPEDLRRTVCAEYGCEAEPFVDLQYALVDVCVDKDTDVLLLRRSELIDELKKVPAFHDQDSEQLIKRMTLPHRKSWSELKHGVRQKDIEVWHLDRTFSVINRPILALDSDEDPLLAISPVLVCEATIYAIGGLQEGNLQGEYWVSKEARQYAGKRAGKEGEDFEDEVADKLRSVGLEATPRQAITKLLDDATETDLGDVDVLAIDRQKQIIWILEAKNLRLCRNERETASRLSEYRGELQETKRGPKPDKLLKHLTRVQHIKLNSQRIKERLKMSKDAEIKGAVVVGTPQPMSFFKIHESSDAEFVHLDRLIDWMAYGSRPGV